MAPLQTIDKDGTVTVVEDPEEALQILRHSTSHLMALAVMELYPDVHLGIGPATSEGFYYDFQTPHRLNEEDLEKIEQKMVELKSQDLSFEPSIVSQEDALDLFRERGEDLKKELIEERAGQVLSCYKLGELVDFCTGPMCCPLQGWVCSSSCQLPGPTGEETNIENSYSESTEPLFLKRRSWPTTCTDWKRHSSVIIASWEGILISIAFRIEWLPDLSSGIRKVRLSER